MKNSTKLIFGFGVLMLVSGCAATLETIGLMDPEATFGHSVRHMIRTQTYNPAAAATAPESAGLDGDKAAMALKTYRSDKSGTASSAPGGITVGE